MPLRPKPLAVTLIEKNFKIDEIGDAENKNYIGPNKYVLNAAGELVELILDNFMGVGIMRLGKLPQLKRLVFAGSSLRDLTALRSICPNLEVLEIKDDYVLENISGLKFLTKLKHLIINATRIWDLSPLYDLIRNGTLQYLNTKGTQLRYPPSELVDTSSISAIAHWFESTWEYPKQLIDECYQTKFPLLDLGNCGITDLSHFPQLFECTHLEKLIQSNEWPYYHDGNWDLIKSANANGVKNNLFYVPNKLKQLSKLKELFISGDWKTRQKDGFWNRGRLQHFGIFTRLPELEFLNVSNQSLLGTVELNKLAHLRVLHLNNNRVRSIEVSQSLPSLELLFLSNNLFRDVSFLNFCPNVTTVDLHQNRLRNLLPIRHLIAKIGVSDTKWSIGTISLAKNTTLRLPKYETVADGTKSVLDYFGRWDKEQEADLPAYLNSDLKIILVGNSSVGKTTLAHWLTAGQIDLKLRSTHWLNRVPWKAQFGRRQFNFHLFDFGGQEYYHDTHFLFFTTDAVYLLLWDRNPYSFDEIIPENSDKKELVQTFPLSYWLDSIAFFADKRQLGTDEIQINKLIDQLSEDQEIEQMKIEETHPNDHESPAG